MYFLTVSTKRLISPNPSFLTINSVNDDPTGTISIIGTALPNQRLTVDLTQIVDVDDSSFLYTYIWQMSSDTNTWDSYMPFPEFLYTVYN